MYKGVCTIKYDMEENSVIICLLFLKESKLMNEVKIRLQTFLYLPSQCDATTDVTKMKKCTDNLYMVFPYLMSNWSYAEYFKIWKLMKF